MRTVLLFTLAAAIAVFVAWWIAALPGAVSITVASYTFQSSTPVAIVLLAVLFLVIYGVVRLLAALLGAPRALRRARRERRRAGGDQAVTRALIALAVNDPAVARREATRSRRLLGDTPLTMLLAAQAGRLAGREDEAGGIFQALAERPDGRILGLRGLLRQAIAAEDWPAAARLAVRAEALHPGATWLAEERRRMALQTGQWGEALRLSSPGKGRPADPGITAALGVAAADQEKDESAGLRLAQQAWEAEPSLAPAAVAYSSRLRTRGRERPAQDVLRRTWAIQPQPDVAAAYLAPFEGAARTRAAQELAAANPAHPASAMLLARTALENGQVADARRHAETARRARMPGRAVWLLLAEIAEVEGNHDAAQDALRHLPAAGADPAWRCQQCGTVHGSWHPVCDACGTPGRIGWTEDTAQGPVQPARPRIPAPAVIEGLG